MPFGLTNAPATFQSLMNLVLQQFLRKCVLVFFDDILIYSSSWSDHLRHLQAVFSVLRAHKLQVKRSKCSFATSSVHYLGHEISAAGVSMDADKVKAFQSWPQPNSVRALRGFLGLAGYYRRFIKDWHIGSTTHNPVKERRIPLVRGSNKLLPIPQGSPILCTCLTAARFL